LKKTGFPDLSGKNFSHIQRLCWHCFRWLSAAADCNKVPEKDKTSGNDYKGAAVAGTASRGRVLKREVLRLLREETLDNALCELAAKAPRQVVNPLFSFLMHEDENVRWRAVSAMGAVINALADQDMEGARVIMRRLMWSLNDESGGIGWGAPEAMGEILARHEGLANEFVPVFISYLNPDGNFLEYELLQRGLMWGLARLARARPQMLADATPFLASYLESSDAMTRGLAAWTSGLLITDTNRPRLEQLARDATIVNLYVDNAFRVFTVGELARRALSLLPRDAEQRPPGTEGTNKGGV
jgi:hypothetical protein